MSEVIVIAARRLMAAQLQAVLRDWTALNLVDPVRIVDLDSLRPDDDRIPAHRLDGGQCTMELLQDGITHREASIARLCVVSAVHDDVGVPTDEQAALVLAAIRGALPLTGIVQVHLIAGSPSDNWAGLATPFMGWHNLALSAEDAVSPAMGSSVLVRDPHDPRWLTGLAGALCALLGLWRGQSGSVLDDRVPAPGAVVVPARTFSRLLTADDVERSLHRRLLAVGRRYPLPTVERTRAVVLEDESSAAADMAESLLVKHADVLPRARIAAPPKPRTDVGVVEALKQFLKFMVNALRNAPGRLAQELVHRISSSTASTVQNMVFGGGDSGFAVVVKGVRSDGSLATWTEFEAELDSVIHRTAPAADLAPPPQKGQLWHDYIDGGMTLLDAGRRCAELPPRSLGAQPAVIATTDRVAARTEDTFTLPAHVAAFLPGWEVEPADDIAAGRLRDQLENLASTTPHLAHELGVERQRLREWSARVSNSYVGQVGQQLGDAFRNTVSEVEELNARIQRLQGEVAAPSSGIDAQQESLAKKLRLLSLGGIALVAGLAVLLVLSVLSPLVASLLIFGTILAWLVAGLSMYLSGQRLLYAYLHGREQAASSLQTARQHRQEALEDLRRLSRAYRQYLDWTRAFAAFVHAPMGQIPESSAVAMHVGRGLPRNIRVGVAVPDPEAVDEVTNRWQKQLFPAGWLSECWREFLAAVPGSLGQLRFPIQSDPNVLVEDANLDGQGPVLTRWSRAAAVAAPGRPASTEFLRKAEELMRTDEQARLRLLSVVRVRNAETGEPEECGRADFSSGLDREYVGTRMAFLDGMFSPHATTVDVRLVRESKLTSHVSGLTGATVLVQFGGAVPITELRGTRAKAEAESANGSGSAPADQRQPWT